MLKARNLMSCLQTVVARQYTGWSVVLFVFVFATVVRLHLRQMPLERDEGEYAYVAQLLLQGKLPYESVYS